jgi:hypothetical protein
MLKNTITVYHCNLCLKSRSVNTKLIGSMFVKLNKLNKSDGIVSWMASSAGVNDVQMLWQRWEKNKIVFGIIREADQQNLRSFITLRPVGFSLNRVQLSINLFICSFS